MDPPAIGASVRVRDAGLDITARIVELNRTLASPDGVDVVRGRLGSRATDVAGFLTGGRRGAGAAAGAQQQDAEPMAEVVVEDGRASPVLRTVYPAGIAEILIEVPIPPASPPPDYDQATGGPSGRPPAPVPDMMVLATIDRARLTGLDAIGGEVAYTVSVDNLEASGAPEDPVPVGGLRGEYRVWALPSAGTTDNATLVWAGVLRGQQAGAPAVVYDSAAPGTTTILTVTIRNLTIINIRATQGATLAIRHNANPWQEVTTMLAIVSAGDDGAFNVVYPVVTVSARAGTLSFAARTGTGTMTDPYQYTGVTPFSLADAIPLTDQVMIMDDVPDDSTAGIAGRIVVIPL